MASQVYEFSVDITCEACAKAVTNVLNKEKGVSNIQIDLDGKKVLVTSSISSDDVLQVLKKSGKSCQFLGVKN